MASQCVKRKMSGKCCEIEPREANPYLYDAPEAVFCNLKSRHRERKTRPFDNSLAVRRLFYTHYLAIDRTGRMHPIRPISCIWRRHIKLLPFGRGGVGACHFVIKNMLQWLKYLYFADYLSVKHAVMSKCVSGTDVALWWVKVPNGSEGQSKEARPQEAELPDMKG